MSTTIPDKPPLVFHAGETLCFDFDAGDYSAAAGWQLSWYVKGPEQSSWAWGTEVAANGTGFRTTVASSVTVALGAGDYWLKGVVVKGSEKHLVYNGNLEIQPDPTDLNGSYDERSHAERVLEKIEQTLESVAGRDEASYSVGGLINQEFEVASREELIKMRNRYKREVNKERQARDGTRSKMRRTRFIG